MKCFNCNKPIPDGAKHCQYCEADQSEMPDLTPEEMQTVASTLEQMMPGGLEQLRAMAGNFETAEEFANAIFVGECPACKSQDVGTFGEVVGVEDPTVARCFACGHLWCSECCQPLTKPDKQCGHWAICEACDEEEECDFMSDVAECPQVTAWLAKQPKDGAGAQRRREA